MEIKLNKAETKATVEGLLDGYEIVIRKIGERWAIGEIHDKAVEANVFSFTFPTDIKTLDEALTRMKVGLPILTAECRRLFREKDKYESSTNPRLKYEYRTYGGMFNNG